MKKKLFLILLSLTTTLIIYPDYSGLRGQTNVVAFPKVYSIFQAKCISCHNAVRKEANLDLEGSGADKSGAVFTNLINKTPANATAAGKGQKLVYPGRADRSFLFHKVNGTFDTYYPALTGNEGTIMPQSGIGLTKTEKEIIRQWILYGATKTATIPENRIKAFYDTVGRGIAAFEIPPPAPAANEGFQIRMGPFFLAPKGTTGSELEYYQKWELAMPNNVEVNRLDHIMSNYSHHLLIYNFTSASSAAGIPAGLRVNANHSNINLVSAVQERTELRLPERTAFKWEKDRILDLNSHYINYSAQHVYKADAYINVYTQPPGTAKQEMFAILIPNTTISIPNTNQTITHEATFLYTGKVYLWALMGHTHKYGTGYKVFKRMPNSTKGELLYDASCPNGIPGCLSPFYDYQHIPMRYFKPLNPVDLNPGFIHQATWKNNGDKTLTFGPTSDDEMMVMIAMYTTDTVGLTPTREVKELDDVQVFPNPMNDRLQIILPPTVGHATIKLYDIMGRVRHFEEIHGHSTEILRGSLERGLYIYYVEDRHGYFKKGKILLE